MGQLCTIPLFVFFDCQCVRACVCCVMKLLPCPLLSVVVSLSILLVYWFVCITFCAVRDELMQSVEERDGYIQDLKDQARLGENDFSIRKEIDR